MAHVTAHLQHTASLPQRGEGPGDEAIYVCISCSEEDVREEGRRGLKPPLLEEVRYQDTAEPPDFCKMVSYLHKRVRTEYTHAHMHTYTYAHIHTCTHAVHTHMHICTHTHMHTCTYIHVRTRMHTCTHAIHTHMHTCTHTHKHTYTFSPSCSSLNL